MSKLWIVHRSPQSRTLLTRLSGRAASEIVSGPPSLSDFSEGEKPDAVVLGLEADFELELEFAHRLRERLGACPLILLAAAEDAAEASRLFETIPSELLESLPSARVLRASIATAFARRRAESLAQRRHRQRIADRFSAWLGGTEIPGLLRALDPALGHLPLLVRGVPGSGRALLARYVELFRANPNSDTGDRRDAIRIHASEVKDATDLTRQIWAYAGSQRPTAASLWIDEIDSLPVSAQNLLSEWIVHGACPIDFGLEGPHWIATARPSTWREPLEPALEHAFSPLVLEIPALGEDPDALPAFARGMARDWSRSVGGPERQLDATALAELVRYPWPGDRAEVEALLRATFASTSRNPIEAEDLGLGPTRAGDRADTPPGETEPLELPIVEAIPEEEALTEVEARPDADATLLEVEDLEIHEGIDPAPIIEGFDTTATDADGVDQSIALAEASFDLAGSDATAEQARAAEPPRAEHSIDPTWRKLARSLSHEIRNPLVSIRSFAALLAEHYEDETFRARFADLVGRDVDHISDVVTRVQEIAEHDASALEAMDVSALIQELLEDRREQITQRRLLVLRELEREAPLAWAEPASLRIALAGLIDRALDSLPERGDLFVATRHLERGQDGEPRLRILLRHHNPQAHAAGSTGLEDLRPEANMLEYVLAEAVARASGGSLTLDSSDAQESLILLELRTPN